MSFFESLRLKARANKYRRRSDTGGIRFLLESLRPGQTALDIGAHKGGYTYWMLRRVGPSGKVYAFEPQQNLFDYLASLKKSQHWDNFTVEHLALSDQTGAVELRIPAGKSKKSSPGASIVKTVFEENEFRTERVAMMTLDAYCAEHQIVPNLLKIDVEGNELAVLQGGEQTLRLHRPAVLMECEARHVGEEQARATFQFLEKLGYRAFFIQDSQFRPLADFDFSKHQVAGQKPYCNNFIFQ